MTQCSICLSNFKDPVCIPCGHVYCKRCLTDYANAPTSNGLSAKCPDCRASFDLVAPDLTYLPEKYHKFVTHNVRRIFVDFSSSSKELRESLKAAEDRLARKAVTEQALLKRCEELIETLDVHRQGERDANQRIMELEDDIANMEQLGKEKDEMLKKMQGLVVDKDKVVEKKPFLDIGMKKKEEELESNKSIRADTSSGETACHSQSANTSIVVRSKPKQRKYVVRLPQGQISSSSDAEYTIQVSTSEDTPIAISMSTTCPSAPGPVEFSRPIKPLPKRFSPKKRLGESTMSIDLSDFL